jgi:hypothetical protein
LPNDPRWWRVPRECGEAGRLAKIGRSHRLIEVAGAGGTEGPTAVTGVLGSPPAGAYVARRWAGVPLRRSLRAQRPERSLICAL